ncbi:hypothetical protein HaLaN_33215 [Haematococcus lacustris]|uniref:Uncharacterized protein n=1 Tax=Haematococcus lacustris TaxID=44745 RepID=A0A6A0APN0_HAELA|nr:hypothetical protein HaLaN_33215 [Haematococcus lacustris]
MPATSVPCLLSWELIECRVCGLKMYSQFICASRDARPHALVSGNSYNTEYTSGRFKICEVLYWRPSA